MLTGSARGTSLRVKAARRGHSAPKSRLGSELHRIQAALLRDRRAGDQGLAELLASIAHEINQPIAAMAMSAAACRRWLQAHPPNLRKAQEALGHIIRDAERAAGLMAGIRRQALGEHMHEETINLFELIRESVELLRDKVRQHAATLRIGPPSAIVRVRGDRTQLQQLLVNLLTNALESLEHSPATRQVRVELRVLRRESVLVSIRDSGCGLTRGAAERMFEAFFTTKPGNMGLGLAICHSIIERHGGRLWATPNQKSGTTFRFSLPLQR
jgi:signal transduction histidine kinase